MDIVKYRNLTSDLKIAQNTLKENEKDFKEAKDKAAYRLKDCQTKDMQITRLKHLMQHAIFHMLIDV